MYKHFRYNVCYRGLSSVPQNWNPTSLNVLCYQKLTPSTGRTQPFPLQHYWFPWAEDTNEKLPCDKEDLACTYNNNSVAQPWINNLVSAYNNLHSSLSWKPIMTQRWNKVSLEVQVPPFQYQSHKNDGYKNSEAQHVRNSILKLHHFIIRDMMKYRAYLVTDSVLWHCTSQKAKKWYFHVLYY